MAEPTPTDAEIDEIYRATFLGMPNVARQPLQTVPPMVRDFARAVLARLGAQPAPAASPVPLKDEQEPDPIVKNSKAPGDLQPGDYVFASRWSDCDPGDPWAVGRVSEVGHYQNSSVYPGYVLLEGGLRRWPNAMRITQEQGKRICEQYPHMEKLPQDFYAIARVFGITKGA